MLLQGPVSSFVISRCAKVVFDRQGLVFRADSVKAGFFAPVLFEGVVIRKPQQRQGASSLRADRLEFSWNGVGYLFSGWRSWIRSASFDGLNIVLDLRQPEFSEASSRTGFQDAAGFLALAAPGGSWPSSITVRNGSCEILGENFRYVLNGLELSLNSRSHGLFRLEALSLQIGKYSKLFGPFTAPTTWDQGNAGLAGLELVPGITLSDLSLRMGYSASPLLSFSARVFGGALRGDVNLDNGPKGKVWDIAVFGSNIAADGFPALLDLNAKAEGTLAEGRLTYRGDVARPVDAEASLRVLAKDFRWNDRGWESLEIGASLIHRRLLISNFDLRQKENKVTLNGEISLSDGWSKISESPFLVNLRANIKELDSVAGLLGDSLGSMKGQLTAEGSVSGRPGSLDGFLGIRGQGVVIHSLPVERVGLEILFRKKQVELVRCELASGQDRLDAKGTVELAAPHVYSAELNATLAELATYLRPFYPKGGGAVSGGAMGLKWKGRGASDAHSGEFDIDLSRFASTLTPAGLTGHFDGFYSPESLYFSDFSLENGKTRLRARATLSNSSLTLEGVELTDASKPLLSGSAFLPVDAFSILGGADWKSAFLNSGDMYLRANTPSEVDLKDVLRLIGQDLPLAGFVKMQLEASGPPSRPDLEALIRGRDMAFGGSDVPVSSLLVDCKTQAGAARLNARLESPGTAPAEVKALFPAGLSQAPDGALRWFAPDSPFEAQMEMPRMDLALARPFLPFLKRLRGEISGHAKINSANGVLAVTGGAEVRAVDFGFDGLASRVERLSGKISILDNALVFQNIEGEIDAGRFNMEGQCALREPWKPFWELRWRADHVPLEVSGPVSLLATGSLLVAGNADGGLLSGDIGIDGSHIDGTLSVRALLSQKPSAVPDFALAARIFSHLAPTPDWSLDVKVNGGGVQLRGEKFTAFLVPDLRLTGTIGRSVPIGRITLRGADAGGFFIDSGNLFFLPDQPWDPFLAVEGEGWFANQLIHAFAFGPLSESKWILSSAEGSPSQSPQDLFLAIERGWLQVPAGVPNAADMFLYSDEQDQTFHVVSSRIAPDTVWNNGINFRESLDYSADAGLFPMDSFRSGFEWSLRPAF